MSFSQEIRRRGSYAPIDFTPEVSQACRKQVEFYFSEYNLPYDKFLRSLCEQNDGWIPITTLASFNRMKKYRPVDKVVDCLKDSTILEVSADGENVRRKSPLETVDFKDRNERVLVFMNFKKIEDEDKDKFLELQEELEKFFNGFTIVNQVRLKKDHKKYFNGVVEVEFKTKEECVKFFEEHKTDFSYQGQPLEVVTKKQYSLAKNATRSKNFGGSGQKTRSLTGYRKNIPKTNDETPETANSNEPEASSESKVTEGDANAPTEKKSEESATETA
ncbi:Lhp1 [Kluyveromyces lactis]|nr:Lhp1 [Kluyveromyces lactis]